MCTCIHTHVYIHTQLMHLAQGCMMCRTNQPKYLCNTVACFLSESVTDTSTHIQSTLFCTRLAWKRRTGVTLHWTLWHGAVCICCTSGLLPYSANHTSRDCGDTRVRASIAAFICPPALAPSLQLLDAACHQGLPLCLCINATSYCLPLVILLHCGRQWDSSQPSLSPWPHFTLNQTKQTFHTHQMPQAGGTGRDSVCCWGNSLNQIPTLSDW